MKIFLSYAAENREIALKIKFALQAAEHIVFFDRDDLPPGDEFNVKIYEAIEDSDIFVFLISPESIAKNSYTLVELGHAKEKWPHPKYKILPVFISPIEYEEIDEYLKSVTVLEPKSNIPAEVAVEVEKWRRRSPIPAIKYFLQLYLNTWKKLTVKNLTVILVVSFILFVLGNSTIEKLKAPARLSSLMSDLRIRANAAESLLRTPCVSAELTIKDAYSYLFKPNSVASFRDYELQNLNPDYIDMGIENILKEINTLLANGLELPGLTPSRESAGQAFRESKYMLAAYDMNLLSALAEQSTNNAENANFYIGKRIDFHSQVYQAFEPFFDKDEEFFKANEPGIDLSASDVYANVKTFDRHNRGVWWQSCKKKAIYCMAVLSDFSPTLRKNMQNLFNESKIFENTQPQNSEDTDSVDFMNEMFVDFISRDRLLTESQFTNIFKEENDKYSDGKLADKDFALNALQECKTLFMEIFPLSHAIK